jgi:Tfp pilus assembly protein PilN
MRNLDKSSWLKRSDLQQTQAKGNDKRDRFEFGLTVKLTSPEEKEKERAAADKTGTAAAADATASKATPPASNAPQPAPTAASGSKP